MGNNMSMKPAAEDDEVATVEIREAPPAHFLIKIESFSLFGTCGIEKYETNEFMAGEYKWRLIISCNENDNDYISVNLAMADTNSLSANGEVNAVFSFFLLNQISGKYLSSIGKTRRFVGIKSDWGFSKFISKEFVLDPSNGYLVNDSCVFGAEVFVLKRDAVNECVCLNSVDTRDWKISNFSKLRQIWHSEEFIARGHKWKIQLHPKGRNNAAGRCVSIFLYYLGSKSMQPCFTISIKNQVSDDHKKQTVADNWFTGTNSGCGWDSFIELATINDPKKGFIVNDTCFLRLEISYVKVAQ